MAQTNYIDTTGLTYCGKAAEEIFSRDVYDLDLRNAGVTFIDGVRSKRKIYLGKFDESVWQQYSCAFSPDGEVSLSESYIEPVAIKVNKEFCRNEFFDSYLVESTEMSLKGGIPAPFAEWYFGKLRQEMKKQYEAIAWQGDTGRTATTKPYLKVTDGWEKKLEENSGVTKISGAVFTVDNIVAQVEATIQAGLAKAATDEVPTDNYKVLMNYADIQLVKMALGKTCCPNNQSIFSNYAMGPEGGVIIYGFELIPTLQSRNTIIFGDPRNLVLGFDTMDSHLSYKIIYMMDTTLDDAYRVAAISNIAIGIVWPEGFTYSRVE